MLNPTIYRYDVHRCTTYNVSETWNRTTYIPAKNSWFRIRNKCVWLERHIYPQRIVGSESETNVSDWTTYILQLFFAGIYVVPVRHICFWFWTNYSLLVFMSFQSDTFVSDSEPTTLCSFSLLLSVTGEATHNNIMAIVWPDRCLIPRSTVMMFTVVPPTMLVKHEIAIMVST
jgi:hypothetical protein